MDVVRKREPRLERAVQELAAEHRELSQALGELVRKAQGTAVSPWLRKRLQEWIARVRQHETREDELIQDAFTQDIGVED